MRRPWPVFLLLAAALVQLASLYLDWQVPAPRHGISPFRGIDGFNPLVGVGEGTAVALVVLVGLAVFALARPALADRLPLGLFAAATSYMMLAVALGARLDAQQAAEQLHSVKYHYAAGTYLGLAAAIAGLVGAVWIQRPETRRYRSALGVIAVALGAAFLVALLLPWTRVGSVSETLGVSSAPGLAAAVLALVILAYWPRSAVLAALVLVFAAGGIAAGPTMTAPAYGAWVGLSVAAALFVVALIEARQLLRRPRELSVQLVLAAAAALLVGSLFLPWESFGSGGRVFLTLNAWQASAAPASAVLALALVVAVAIPEAVPFGPGLLSAALVVLVGSLALEYADIEGPGTGGQIRYGAMIGIAALSVVALFTLMGLRNRAFAWRRDLSRTAPVAACLAYLFFLLVPTWHVLPLGVEEVLGYGFLTWPVVVGAIGAVVLIGQWTRQIALPGVQEDWLVGLPLGLLALEAVDVIHAERVTWDSGTVLGLCVLLAALAVFDAKLGLERLPFPEILRVDRL